MPVNLRASGVYYTLIDESMTPGGATALNAVILMLTTRGEVGKFNTVTMDNFEERLGYDLGYNPNYLGLKAALGGLAKVDVLRLNVGAKLGNNTAKVSVGTPGTPAVPAVPAVPATSGEVELQLSNASGGDVTLPPGTYILNLGVGYTFIVPDTGLEIVDGSSEVVTAIANSAGVDASIPAVNDSISGSDFDLSSTSDPSGAVLNTLTVIVVAETAGTALIPEIPEIPAVPGTQVIDWVSIADVENWDELAVSASAAGSVFWFGTATPGDSGKFAIRITPNVDPEVDAPSVLAIAQIIGGNPKIAFNKPISQDPTSDYFIEKQKLPFGLKIGFNSGFDLVTAPFTSDWIEIEGSSNGMAEAQMRGASLDLSAFDKSNHNIVVINGFAEKSVIDEVTTRNHLERFVFANAPVFLEFEALSDWQSRLANSEYLHLSVRHDIQDVPEVGEVIIWGSIKMLQIYSQMFRAYGHLNYPPAGYTYGNSSFNRLPDDDFMLYRSELKSQRMNYLWAGPDGPVVWENRTRYALESDLSYCPTVFILMDLKVRLINYMFGFLFRFTSPEDLLIIQTGLNTILSDFQGRGFLAGYTLKVPTFSEAQKSRENTINIAVQCTKDGEVWDLIVRLVNGLV